MSSFFSSTQGYRFAVSSITVYELPRGDNQDEDQYWKAMFANMEVLAFDSGCTEQAAFIYKDLNQKGLLIEAEDLLVAATARYHRLKLASAIFVILNAYWFGIDCCAVGSCTLIVPFKPMPRNARALLDAFLRRAWER